jgi:outer membrane protein
MESSAGAGGTTTEKAKNKKVSKKGERVKQRGRGAYILVAVGALIGITSAGIEAQDTAQVEHAVEVEGTLSQGTHLETPDLNKGKMILSLDQAVELAMERNENLLVAQAQRQSSGQRVREIRANALPSLDLSVNYGRNWVRPTFVFGGQSFRTGTENNVNARFDLRQAIYSGGRLGAALDAARETQEYAKQIERGVGQQVRAAVEEALYDVLLARDLAQVSRQALETARANLRQVKALHRAGRVPEYDLLQAQVQVASLQADSIQAHNTVVLEEMQFKSAIGEPLDSPRLPSGIFRSDSELATADVAMLLEQAAQLRAELLQSRHLLKAGSRSIDFEKAQNNPSLDFVSGGQMQFQSDEFDLDKDGNWARSWSTGLELEIPLFDGHRTGARVSLARLELRQLELQARQTQRAIELEVRQALMRLGEARDRLKAEGAAVEYAGRGLSVAQVRYRNGAGTQLEIHDAQLALVEARTGLVRARRDRAGAIVELERSVGVLGER